MEGLLVIAAFIVIAVVFIKGWQMFRSYVNRSADTPDYNPYKEYFTVPMTEAEIHSALKLPMFFDGYTSEYLRDEGLLKFHSSVQSSETCEYRIVISPMEQLSVITASPVIPSMGKQNFVDLEAFFARKLGASKINSADMRPHS